VRRHVRVRGDGTSAGIWTIGGEGEDARGVFRAGAGERAAIQRFSRSRVIEFSPSFPEPLDIRRYPAGAPNPEPAVSGQNEAGTGFLPAPFSFIFGLIGYSSAGVSCFFSFPRLRHFCKMAIMFSHA